MASPTTYKYYRIITDGRVGRQVNADSTGYICLSIRGAATSIWFLVGDLIEVTDLDEVPYEAFALTSIEPTIACFGTSYPTLIAAKNYAADMKHNYGLCSAYNVQGLKDGKWEEVYTSR